MRVNKPAGSPQNPLAHDAVEEKFRDCAQEALPARKIEKLLGLFSRFEQLEDLREITRGLEAPVLS